MTTNVLDRRSLRLTTDSRWSIDDPAEPYVYFVDDTGFDKMADRPTSVMVCAGNAALISMWMDWFTAEAPAPIAPPSHVINDAGDVVAEIAVTIVQKPGFTVEFSYGLYDQFEDAAWFCGSGRRAAKDCFSVNGCSIQCVATAGQYDPCTGGETKFYELATFSNNLSNPRATAQDMLTKLVEHGSAMNRITLEVTPMNPMTQDELRKKIANGTLAVSAPTGAPLRGWSDRERHDVQEVMKRIVERERAANAK